MTKLLYISAVSAPHQIKLCSELNKYIEAEFWFYHPVERYRPSWWKIPLCDRCTILDKGLVTWRGKTLPWGITKKLNEARPNILMLGGFSNPGNYLAYRWALKRSIKIIVFTELSRNQKGELRKFSLGWRLLKWLYRKVDFVFTSNQDAFQQFKEDFGFGSKVIATRYASDLDRYFKHPVREARDGYRYLFANRLVALYNPLKAIDVFYRIYLEYPASTLVLNNEGELRQKCEEKIKALGIDGAVSFVGDIQDWEDLPSVYEHSDILLFPAKFSNGNFSIYEAMASGMGLVISTEINGHGDVLSDGVNCFIRPPHTESFELAVREYVENPDLFSVHAEINRQLVYPLSIKGTALFFLKIFVDLKLVDSSSNGNVKSERR